MEPSPLPTGGFATAAIEGAKEAAKQAAVTPKKSAPVETPSTPAAMDLVKSTGKGQYAIAVQGDPKTYFVSDGKVAISQRVSDPKNPGKTVQINRDATLEEVRALERAVKNMSPRAFPGGSGESKEVKGILTEHRQNMVQENKQGKATAKVGFVGD